MAYKFVLDTYESTLYQAIQDAGSRGLSLFAAQMRFNRQFNVWFLLDRLIMLGIITCQKKPIVDIIVNHYFINPALAVSLNDPSTAVLPPDSPPTLTDPVDITLYCAIVACSDQDFTISQALYWLSSITQAEIQQRLDRLVSSGFITSQERGDKIRRVCYYPSPHMVNIILIKSEPTAVQSVSAPNQA